MTIMDKKWSALPVPYAIEALDRVPKERYFDPDFFGWRPSSSGPGSGRWRVVSRRSPQPVTSPSTRSSISRSSSSAPRKGSAPFDNACRHRGVRLAQGRGSRPGWFRLPVPRLVLRHRRAQHPGDPAQRVLRAQPRAGRHRPRPGPLRDVGRLRLDQPRRRRATLARQCIEPFATVLDAWKVESLRAEWWYACRLPVNWKLAEEAFVEQYHVLQAHPQLRIPSALPRPRPGRLRSRVRSIDGEAPVPADDERGHGRDGARPRRRDRRVVGRPGAPPRLPAAPARRGSAASTTR